MNDFLKQCITVEFFPVILDKSLLVTKMLSDLKEKIRFDLDFDGPISKDTTPKIYLFFPPLGRIGYISRDFAKRLGNIIFENRLKSIATGSSIHLNPPYGWYLVKALYSPSLDDDYDSDAIYFAETVLYKRSDLIRSILYRTIFKFNRSVDQIPSELLEAANSEKEIKILKELEQKCSFVDFQIGSVAFQKIILS